MPAPDARQADPEFTDDEIAEMAELLGGLQHLTTTQRMLREGVPRLIAALRASRESEDKLAEALRLVMKDVQEPGQNGVIYGPGDIPYDVLTEYDRRTEAQG